MNIRDLEQFVSAPDVNRFCTKCWERHCRELRTFLRRRRCKWTRIRRAYWLVSPIGSFQRALCWPRPGRKWPEAAIPYAGADRPRWVVSRLCAAVSRKTPSRRADAGCTGLSAATVVIV